MKRKYVDQAEYRESLLLKMGMAEPIELHSETPIGDVFIHGKAVWTSELWPSARNQSRYLVKASFALTDGTTGEFSILRNENRELRASHVLALRVNVDRRAAEVRIAGLVSQAPVSGIEGPLSVVELPQPQNGVSVAGLLAEENPLVENMVCLTEATSFLVNFFDQDGRRNVILLPIGESGRQSFNRFMLAENRAYVAGVMFGYEHATPPTLTLPPHLRNLEVRY